MKKNILTLVAVTCSLTITAQTAFFEGTLRDAAAKAKIENKYIFIDCYTDWCGWCKVADKTTFASERVGEFMNKKFVSVKLDMENGEGVDLGMKYRISGYPSFLIFNPEGNIVSRMFGYIKGDSEFVAAVKVSMLDENQYKYVSNINDGLKFPDFYTASFTNKSLDKNRKYPEPLQVTKWLATQTDLYSEQSWGIMSRFDLDEKMEKSFLKNHKQYRSLYGNDEVNDKVVAIASSKLDQSLEKQDETILESALGMLETYLPDKKMREQQIIKFRMKYAEKTENWASYAKMAKGLFEIGGVKEHLSQANSFAWTLYLKSDDQEILASAGDWMAQVIDIDPNYAYMDTYAALLYKTGSYEKAEAVAEKAIKIGIADEEKVGETEKLLEEVRKAAKKK